MQTLPKGLMKAIQQAALDVGKNAQLIKREGPTAPATGRDVMLITAADIEGEDIIRTRLKPLSQARLLPNQPATSLADLKRNMAEMLAQPDVDINGLLKAEISQAQKKGLS